MLSPPSRMWSPTATRVELELAALLGDGDQREVGGAAADVDDEDHVADAAPACARRRRAARARRRTRPAAPRAASTLREPGLLRGLDRQLARGGVERRGHGERRRPARRAASSGNCVVPGARAGARGSAREASSGETRATSSGACQRQDRARWRSTPGWRQPALRGRDEARRAPWRRARGRTRRRRASRRFVSQGSARRRRGIPARCGR